MGALLESPVCSRHFCQGHRDASLAGRSLMLLLYIEESWSYIATVERPCVSLSYRQLQGHCHL